MAGNNLVEINIEEEIKRSYLDYALSVIIGRAIPDIRDGLKPVQRRIVFAMSEMGNTHNKPYKKSARIVGDVIGKYHPHGDAAVYDATVRLAQDFTMRYPLVDGQGNFGSIDGDPAAAMRYTEIRLDRIATQLLEDIDKATVRFVPNYDASMEEPEVLPSRIPNLLINGSSGIAVGMATNIPPHNLGEIIDGLVMVLEEPGVPVERLLQVITGPDFPTGGIIYGRQGIRDAYLTGKGTVKVRAKAFVEKSGHGDKCSIVVTELPYQVNKARLLEKIDELIKEKVIEGIEELRDETDKDGTRIVIHLKKNEIVEVILNKLFKHTQMESNFGIIFLAIDDGMPRHFNLKEVLERFIRFRTEIVVKRTRFELDKATEQCHLLEGLKIALENLDLVLRIIRGAENPKTAAQALVERVKLTDKQAQAILEMRLQKLTRLEKEKLLAEYEALVARIADYRDILASERRVRDIVKTELQEIRETYGDARRTEIVDEAGEINYEDLILDENMVVTITHRGYIKRSPLSIYRTQKRGGKGKVGITVADMDFVEHLFISSTHSYFLVFTDMGRVHWLKVHEIPEAGRTARGKPVVNLLQLQEGENVTTVLPVREFKEGTFVVMATQRGVVKKTEVMAFSHPRSLGIHAVTLDSDDRLISAVLTGGQDKLFLATRDGKALTIEETQIREMGRAARGVRGIRLRAQDRLIAMNNQAEAPTLLTITEKGYGKRTAADQYRVQMRGGIGLTNVKISDKNGRVVNVLPVREDDNIVLITNHGKLIRIRASDVKIVGRATIGVKLMDLGEDESVVAAQKILEPED
jgi:DNA gyrase subunit A